MKSLIALLLLAGPVSAATTISYSDTWTVNTTIPDNDPRGWMDQRRIRTLLSSTDIIEINLVITGGWNGDLYAWVKHNDGFSILLNRVGSTASDGAGSSASGMNVTFSSAATNDIHTASIFAGTFAPDGRIADPDAVTNLSPRTAMLDSFLGEDPDGTWTLFIADMAYEDQSKIVSWGITVTQVVPEPSSAAAIGVPLLLAGGALFRRHRESR